MNGTAYANEWPPLSHDAMTSITPQIAKYLAARSCYGVYRDEIEFKPGDEAIETAMTFLKAELEQQV